MLKHSKKSQLDCDVVLIGGGIMSATLGTFLKELQPDLSIQVFERLDKLAAESSDAWNNAGTGHSALCELNYTPEREDGSIDISKAIKIVESFEVSKQFWAYLVGQGFFASPHTFINSIPHMSLVWGAENIDYLHRRYEAMQACHLFKGMQYTEDEDQLRQWVPLIMQHRDPKQQLAATHIDIGTDVNFGALTHALFAHLQQGHGLSVALSTEVTDLQKTDGYWTLEVKNSETGEERTVRTQFVFIGAGGGSLPLLEKSDIDEGKGFGGFPVSGQWLICKNEDLIKKHHAKVYGKASVGAPPMSVPHLDTRIIDGKKALLFGPYAGFSTRFLKEGSLLDLPLSIHIDNIRSMLGAGIHNIPLTKYLIEQVTQSEEDRLDALREFVPDARAEDWELATAGQRVQVIKGDPKDGGVLEFGTEIVAAADGSIAALLGASPGASTSVSIMFDLMQRCFPDQMASKAWQTKLKQMIPSYGQHLADDAKLATTIRRHSHQVLGLTV